MAEPPRDTGGAGAANAAPPTGAASAPAQGAELARLVASQVCLHACMAGIRLAAPLLALREGYSNLAVGVLLALFALSQVFLALPVGRYADRHGLKRPMAWSIAAAVLAGALGAAWPVYPVLCLSALLSGGAAGATVIALQRHVGRRAHDTTQLRQAFSWLSIGPAFSNFVGPFAAGWVIDLAGFRAAFALMAALPLLSAWLVRVVPEVPDLHTQARAPAGRAWDLWREPGFRRLMLVNWFLSSSWDAHTFVLPVLGHERGLSASTIGSILGAFAIAASGIRVVLPMLAHRVREWALVAGAMVSAAAVFAVYPLMHHAIGMGVCSVLLGVALGSVQPMIMSMLHQITPHHRHGEAVGMRLMVINASSVSMPLLFGAAGAVIGVAGLFWTVSAVLAVGVRQALGLRDRVEP